MQFTDAIIETLKQISNNSRFDNKRGNELVNMGFLIHIRGKSLRGYEDGKWDFGLSEESKKFLSKS